MDWKKYAEIALVSVITLAIVFRVGALRSTVTGLA